MAAGILAFLLLQTYGKLGACIRWLAAHRLAGRTLQNAAHEISAVDDALKTFYRVRPWGAALAVGWHMRPFHWYTSNLVVLCLPAPTGLVDDGSRRLGSGDVVRFIDLRGAAQPGHIRGQSHSCIQSRRFWDGAGYDLWRCPASGPVIPCLLRSGELLLAGVENRPFSALRTASRARWGSSGPDRIRHHRSGEQIREPACCKKFNLRFTAGRRRKQFRRQMGRL